MFEGKLVLQIFTWTRTFITALNFWGISKAIQPPVKGFLRNSALRFPGTSSTRFGTLRPLSERCPCAINLKINWKQFSKKYFIIFHLSNLSHCANLLKRLQWLSVLNTILTWTWMTITCFCFSATFDTMFSTIERFLSCSSLRSMTSSTTSFGTLGPVLPLRPFTVDWKILGFYRKRKRNHNRACFHFWSLRTFKRFNSYLDMGRYHMLRFSYVYLRKYLHYWHLAKFFYGWFWYHHCKNGCILTILPSWSKRNFLQKKTN